MIFTEFLRCPKCKGKLRAEKNKLVCAQNKHTFTFLKRRFPSFVEEDDLSKDVRLTLNKWESVYDDPKEDLSFDPNDRYLKTSQEYINKFWINKGNAFLELGCGFSWDSLVLALKGKIVWGIDISPTAIYKTARLFDRNKAKGYFVHGNMLSLPFSDNTFDFIYAGGTIEHVDNTHRVVREIKRVLKKDGIIFATVPHCNLGMLTYGQLNGNIPNIAFIKDIFIFIHRRLLAEKYMIQGFELSFTKNKIKEIFNKVGFKSVVIGDYECYNEIRRVRNLSIKHLLQRLSKHNWFSPLIYVSAQK